MKYRILLTAILIAFVFHPATAARHPNLSSQYPKTRSVDHVIWDGNNVSTWHGNHGDIVSFHVTSNAGLEWPKGSGKYAVFQSGLWLAAGIVNDEMEIRTAAAAFSVEYVPGNRGSDWNDPSYRIYEITADDGPGSENWQQWPVDQGAPWIDTDGDGSYDPTVDKPDVAGDLVHWYVMNDGDDSTHLVLWETAPLDVEIRVTMFGFDTWGPLRNTLFVKYQIINTGQNELDSIFASFWSDPDIGDATDDLVGCSPDLNLGYAYNDDIGFGIGGADDVYGENPPAVGYLYLQTPVVSSQSDTAYISGKDFLDHVNLPITAFSKMLGGNPTFRDPNTALEVYRYMNGLDGGTGEPYINPITGQPSPFVNDGDPVTEQGWIDTHRGLGGDRRFLLSSGPFSMAPGDTQEVVMAILTSQGDNNVASVAALRTEAVWVEHSWKSGFISLWPPWPPASLSELQAPDNTESTGPLEFFFQIQENPVSDAVLESFYLHYGLGGILDSTAVTETTYKDILAYTGTVPGFPDVTGTTILNYYVSARFDDGTTMYWPTSAPRFGTSLVFGPDTTAPVITNLSDLCDVPYFMDDVRRVSVRIEDDRFPLSAIAKWRVGAHGKLQESAMVQEEGRWMGEIHWEDLSPRDTIYYWVEATDSSQNLNHVRSESKSFRALSYARIGDWDHHLVDRWDLGRNWRLDSYSGYEEIMVNFMPGSDLGKEDTLALTHAIRLTQAFPGTYLQFDHVYVIPDSSVGHLDIRPASGEWIPLETFAGLPSSFQRTAISLDSYIGVDSVYLQFRIFRDGDGAAAIWYLDDIYLLGDSSRISVKDDELTVPSKFALQQPYPNPFNPVTTVEFSVAQTGPVTLTVYDLLGREVETILNQNIGAGHHNVQWNATNVSSGIYFIRMQNSDFSQVRKVMVLR